MPLVLQKRPVAPNIHINMQRFETCALLLPLDLEAADDARAHFCRDALRSARLLASLASSLRRSPFFSVRSIPVGAAERPPLQCGMFRPEARAGALFFMSW